MLQNKPSHWADVPIGEILKYLDDQVMFDDMAEYITITVKRRHGGLEAREKLFGHEIKTKKQYRLHRGAFIISRVQCWHAAYAIVPDDIPENMIASQNYDQFEISPKADRRFFWWLSHSPQFIETVRSSASGVVIEKLVFNRDAWLQKTIPIPPLDEQRRIVAHIESLAARVNEAQRLREEAESETNVFIKSAQTQLFESNTGKLWTKKKLSDVALVARGKFTHRPRNEPRFYGGDIPFIQIGDISNSNRYIYDYSQTLNEDGLKISRMFNKGTIVIAITGATIGVTGILGIDACFPDSIVGIVANSEFVSPEYLYWALEHAKQVALEQATQTTQPNINLRILDTITIPVPPLDEQRRIVGYLDGLQAKVNALWELQSKSGEELSALMASVLDRAFKGEL